MTGYVLLLIIFIVICFCFGGVLAFNIMMSIIKSSNMAGECKSDFYHNTKLPMRIHAFTMEETLEDMHINPEYYKIPEEE